MASVATLRAREALHIVHSLLNVAPAGVRQLGSDEEPGVFEVVFSVRRPLVVQITTSEYRQSLIDMVRLSRKLRLKGVPLPSIIASSLEVDRPFVVLERLPGVDLGMAMRCLSRGALHRIANSVARVQKSVGSLPSGMGYGVAALPGHAPHERWSSVINALLEHLRWQLSAKRDDVADLVEKVDWAVVAARRELDACSATAFLHDATTSKVMVTLEGEFSGIVMGPSLCFGDPRLAVARTEASLWSMYPECPYVDYLVEAAGYQRDRIYRLYVALFLLDVMAHIADAQVKGGRDDIRSFAARYIGNLTHEWGLS